MADRWVVNASPLILLGKAGILPLLPALCDELVVPAGVVAEVQQGRIADIGRTWLAADGARYVHPTPLLHPLLANWNGGAGEAGVISWALGHPEFVAVLDDQAARRLASQHGVRVIGSLRVSNREGERAGFDSARATCAGKVAGRRRLRERRIDRSCDRTRRRGVSQSRIPTGSGRSMFGAGCARPPLLRVFAVLSFPREFGAVR